VRLVDLGHPENIRTAELGERDCERHASKLMHSRRFSTVAPAFSSGRARRRKLVA